MVRKSKQGRKTHLKLTARGKAFLEKHHALSNKSRPPWDRRWRLVIFDVPESKAELRKYLREYLIAMGFGKVQRSVWISPYDFREEIERYIRKLKLSNYVLQLLVEDFEGLSGEQIATTFWDLKSVHSKYVKFYRHWSERMNKLEELMRETTNSDPVLCRRYIASLNWDYQAALARDPYLPIELLPDDWGGKIAQKFVQECRNKFLQS
ncbi:MAG: CRISPR-associated endonuclease Cas2 [Candidatus Euphemobacter frigidus]|nr:CRISPR-associated endonuclease Cas2 [Candidatus Euphemobacter frigidus]MDP8275325.1 CRISPR-associated endonuclease Cas2 [Candidatus Euphemobacter frigidus]